MNRWIYLLTFLPLIASATSVKKTGASSMGADQFLSCIDQSVNGKNDGDCTGRGDAFECIGFRGALEYSTKRTHCMTTEPLNNITCPLYGHKQYSEQDWLSAAAGHLDILQECIKQRYRDNGNDDSTQSTLEAALADTNFLALLRSLDEGANAFEIRKGTIIERVLRGERFPKIISESAFLKKNISLKEQEAFRIGADTPMKFGNTQTEAPAGYEYSPNYAQRGISLEKTTRENYLASVGIEGSFTQLAKIPPTPIPTELKKAEAITDNRMPAATATNSVYIKDLRDNPYSLGLDRSLFDRVSLTYQKRARQMRNIDQFIQQQPQRNHSIEDIISRGKAIEL